MIQNVLMVINATNRSSPVHSIIHATKTPNNHAKKHICFNIIVFTTATISTGTASSQDAYEYMEFTFDLPGVSLTLYKNEKDLVSISKQHE